MSVETTSTRTEGQNAFLEMAERRGVDIGAFTEQYTPEIKFQEEKPDSTKPTIAYIHTGGTLMMVPSQEHDGALSFKSAIDVQRVIQICDLIASVRKRYNIIGVFLANDDSKEVRRKLWTALAATIQTLYPDIEGAVVGHGTHTLEYSAAALAYAIQQPAIPIIPTASQIPIIGHPGSDGMGNLTGAMEIAANGDVAEVAPYTHGQLFRGTRVTKKNDNRLDVFEARVTGPIGYFTAGGVELMPGARRRSGKRKHETRFQPQFSEHVSTIKVQPGMSKELLDRIVKGRKDVGIILETYGSGAVPRDFLGPISRHTKAGYPIFVTSSCAESGVSPTMQLHDEDAIEAYKSGLRNVRDMSTTAATVKLMHIKGTMPDAPLDVVREEMIDKNYAGEITIPKSGHEEY